MLQKYQSSISTERKLTQELHLHHNSFEMFAFKDVSHRWEKKEMIGSSIRYVSGDLPSSLVGKFLFWSMRSSVYFQNR